MKNFIYLPILVVLFLCGCKSNSFTTQRYTHFDHGTSKTALHKPVVHEQIPAPYIAMAAEQSSFYASDVFDKYTRPMEEAAAEKQNANSHELNAIAAVQSSQHFQSVKSLNPVKTIKSAAQGLMKAGMKQQSKAAKHGLIFGIINLALFIVLCVIFVAGVIFLVMLLAV